MKAAASDGFAKPVTGVQRNSSIEYLRLLSMFLIVLGHFSAHGGFDYATSQLSVNRVWTQLTVLGSVGVDVFVLISGYFLIDSKTLKLERLIKLWLPLFVYSTGLYLLLCLLGKAEFSPAELLRCCFPVLEAKWWFASAYFLLYLFHPFLNQYINSVSKRTYLATLAIMTLLWCVIPTFTNNDNGCNDLIWLVYLYLLAGWIKRYMKLTGERRRYVRVGLCAMALLFLSTISLDLLGLKAARFGRLGNLFYIKDSIFVVVLALSLFLYAISCKPTYSKTVNNLAKTTFGIYLIHEYEPMRNFIWGDLFRNASYADSGILIPYTLFAVVSVLLGAGAVESVRLALEKRLVSPWLRNASAALERRIEAGFERLVCLMERF